MPDTTETRVGNGGDTVEQARSEVRSKVKEAEKAATKEEEKRQKEKIADDVKKEVKDAVEQVERARRAGAPIETATKQKLTSSLAKALEAANQGILEIPDQANELLTRIARASPSDSTASAINEHIGPYLLGDKRMIVDGKVTDDFKRALDELRAANPNAADLISNSIAAQPERFGLSGEEARKLGIDREEMERAIRERQTEVFGTKDIYGPEDVKRHDTLNEIITKAVFQAFEENKKLKPDDPRYFLGSDNEIIGRYRFYDTVPEDKLAEAVKKLPGVTLDEIKEFVNLHRKIFPRQEASKIASIYIKQPTLLRAITEAIGDFNPEAFKKQFLPKVDKDGNFIFAKEDRLRFKKMIQKYYYVVLEQIHENKSTPFSQSLQGNYEFNYYLGALNGLVFDLCNNLKSYHFQNNPEIQDFLSYASSTYQANILFYAQVFHDLPLHARHLETFDKWGEFIGNLFPSSLAEVFDEEDRLMQMARDEITMYIRRRLIQNGNKYPHDLISGNYNQEGARWGLIFEQDIREALQKRAERLGIKIVDWEMKRILTYAAGIGIANLVDVEVMSTADPDPGNFRGIHPLMAALAAKHNWTLGRGDPLAGVIAKYLLKMDVSLFPEERGFVSRLLHKKRWVPKEFAEAVEQQRVKYGDKVFEMLLDRQGSYQELLSMVNIAASLIGRAGWRMAPLSEELKSLTKDIYGLNFSDAWKEKWTEGKWRAVWDMSLKKYGNASLWWFLTTGPNRIEGEMRSLLASQIGIDEANRLFDNYQKGNRHLQFEINGQKKSLNFLEIRELRRAQLRGEAFFRYMRRNPGDFFLLMSQLVPELVELDANVFKNEADIRGLKGKTKIEVERLIGRRNQILARWGRNHFETLKTLNQWFSKYVGEGRTYKTAADFIKALVFESGTAYEKMMNKNEPLKRQIEAIQKSDKSAEEKKREIDSLLKQMRMYLTKEDFGKDGEDIAEAIFGEEGMMKILTELNADKLDEFYKNFGDYSQFGTENFFYRAGHAWTMKNSDVNPFSSDFDHYAVYRHLGEVGEDVAKRFLGDANMVKKMIEGVAKLDDLLRTAADGGNFEKIYELHKLVFDTLKPAMGDEYAHQANYILASIVTQYYWEHSITRDPKLKWLLPASMAARGLLGRSISLSKIESQNWHAYSMDENAARTYFRKLAFDPKLRVIPTKGLWSHEQLELAFDAKTDTFILGDVAPTFIWFVMAFLIWTYMKKAIEEAEGKKK